MLDREYLLRRVLQEDEAARRAACEAARTRHEELAAAYRRRLFPPMEQSTGRSEAFLARLESHGNGQPERDALTGGRLAVGVDVSGSSPIPETDPLANDVQRGRLRLLNKVNSD